MNRIAAAEQFLIETRNITSKSEGRIAFTGETARCLWLLLSIPEQSIELWSRFCWTFPVDLEFIGVDPVAPSGRKSSTPIATEFADAILQRCILVDFKLAGKVPLADPTFVLAEMLMDSDPLAAVRVAALVRCLQSIQKEVELEEVRAVLKAVNAGECLEMLKQLQEAV